MAEVQLQVCITIVGARDLPKTDRLSSIDPYIVVNVPGTHSHDKTKALDNTANPSWNSEHLLFVNFNPSTGALSPLSFELWDENSVSKDEKVGTVDFQLQPAHLQNPALLELPITMIKDKHAKHHSLLLVRFGEYAYSCRGLYSIVKNIIPNITFHDTGLGRLYIPLSIPNVVLAVEYEKKCADLKLYITAPDNRTYLDMVRANHQTSVVRRRNVARAASVYQNISFFEEIKMNDVPFSVLAQPGSILVFSFQKELLSSTGLDQVVSAHGWKGSLNFAGAAAMLKDVQLDKKEEEIFMRRDDSFIVVDFDQGNVDMKCLVLDSPENTNLAYDFAYKGDDVKKTTEIYSPPKTVLDGKYRVQRKLELDDVPYGTPFSKMEWFKYRVSAPTQVSFFDILRVHPF